MKKNKLAVTKVGTKIGKRTKFTIEEKIEVLRLLKENSYNYKKTAMEAGVVYGTLKNWFTQYRDRLNNLNAVEVIAENVEVNLSKTKTRFIEKHFKDLNDLAEEAIKRALTLIKDEPDLNKVNGTLKVIGELITKVSGIEEDGENKTSSNLIQQTIVMMNQVNDNAK